MNSLCKILLIEESPDDRRMVRHYLQSELQNYELQECSSAQQGLMLCAQASPDLILLNYHLPDLNALEFLAQLQQQMDKGHPPILVFTNYGDEAIAVQVIKAGAQDYLVKGKLTPKGLCRAIKSSLERVQLMQKIRHQQDQQQLINTIALRIRQSLQLQDVLNTAVREIRQFLKVDRALVYQLNCDRSGKIVAESVLPQWVSCLNIALQPECFPSQHLESYRLGKVWVMPDVYNANLSACHIQLLERFQVKASLVVPIWLESRELGQRQAPDQIPSPRLVEMAESVEPLLWGLLVVHQCQETRQWDLLETDLLEQLSVQVAISIQQAELYRSLQTLNCELERKVEERTAALTRSERKFRAIFNNTFHVTWLLTPEGILLEANQTALDFAGISLAQVQSQPFAQTHWWQGACVSPTQLQDAIARAAQGEFVRYEVDILGARGQFATIDFSLRPVRDDTGQIVLLIPEGRDITERKQAEAALRQSEATNRAILQAIPDWLVRMNRAGDYLFILNDDAIQLFRSTDSMIGKNIYDLLPHHLAEERLAYARKALETGETQSYEFEIEVDGKLCYEEARIAVIGSSDDVLVMIRDITDRRQGEIERKQAEAALRQSEATNRAILQAIPDFLTSVNRSGEYLYVKNGGDVKLTKPICELKTSGLYQALPMHLAEQRMHYIQQALATGESQLYEYEIEVEGELRYEEARIVVSGPDETLVMIRDITARKRAEQDLQKLNSELERRVQERTAALQQSEALLRGQKEFLIRLINTVPHLIFVKDWHGSFHLVNQATANIYHTTVSELIGKRDADFNPDEAEVEQFLRADREVMATAKTVVLEETVTSPTGEKRYFQTIKVPLTSEDGRSRQILGVATDITQHRQMQELLLTTNQQLMEANAELERATRLKDEFLASMSHELRTPLNAILGISEGFQDEVYGVLNDRQRRAIATIERSGKHLLDLINDILDLAKIEAGKVELSLAPVQVKALCESSLTFVRQQAIKKNIHLTYTCDLQNLGLVEVDERRIRQVLINLLSNAVKFTPEGGSVLLKAFTTHVPPDTIGACAHQASSTGSSGENCPSGHKLCFAVLDTGIGIAPEHLGQLFQPFSQIDSSLSRQHPGTGLGLVLASRITELHGGNIMVTSQVNQGSCFTVYLPYRPASRALPSSALPSTVLPVGPGHLLSVVPLLLLVDDNQANLELLFDYLSARSYRLLTSLNGRDAIAMAQTHRPDLIILDIQMPDMDGLETARHLRGLPELATVPIIALTALAMPGDLERCLEAGADYYMTKPVSLKQLVATIQQLLQNV